MKKEIFLECDCYSEGIKFNYDNYGFLNISLYQRGFKPRTRSWKEKLRWIWQIIKKDVPYDDEVMLSKDKVEILAQFMNEISPNNNVFVKQKTPNKQLQVGKLYILENESLPFRYVKYSNQEDDVYYFKHHQLKTHIFYNTNKVLREANQKEVNLYNSLKKEMNDLANRIC